MVIDSSVYIPIALASLTLKFIDNYYFLYCSYARVHNLFEELDK
jgi:hypothetical protein